MHGKIENEVVKIMKNQEKNSRLAAMFLLFGAAMLTMTVMTSTIVTASGVPEMGTTAGWMFIGGIITIFVGVVILIATKDKKPDFAWGSFIVSLVLAGALIAIPMIETDATPDTSQFVSTDYSWTVFDGGSNDTAICDLSGDKIYTWDVDYNTTSNAIVNNTQTITYSYTVTRADGLADEAKFKAYVTNIGTADNDVTGATGIEIIDKTGAIYTGVDWTDGTNAWTNSISADRLPIDAGAGTPDSTPLNVTITLESGCIEALTTITKDTCSFQIVFEEAGGDNIDTFTMIVDLSGASVNAG